MPRRCPSRAVPVASSQRCHSSRALRSTRSTPSERHLHRHQCAVGLERGGGAGHRYRGRVRRRVFERRHDLRRAGPRARKERQVDIELLGTRARPLRAQDQVAAARGRADFRNAEHRVRLRNARKLCGNGYRLHNVHVHQRCAQRRPGIERCAQRISGGRKLGDHIQRVGLRVGGVVAAARAAPAARRIAQQAAPQDRPVDGPGRYPVVIHRRNRFRGGGELREVMAGAEDQPLPGGLRLAVVPVVRRAVLQSARGRAGDRLHRERRQHRRVRRGCAVRRDANERLARDEVILGRVGISGIVGQVPEEAPANRPLLQHLSAARAQERIERECVRRAAGIVLHPELIDVPGVVPEPDAVGVRVVLLNVVVPVDHQMLDGPAVALRKRQVDHAVGQDIIGVHRHRLGRGRRGSGRDQIHHLKRHREHPGHLEQQRVVGASLHWPDVRADPHLIIRGAVAGVGHLHDRRSGQIAPKLVEHHHRDLVLLLLGNIGGGGQLGHRDVHRIAGQRQRLRGHRQLPGIVPHGVRRRIGHLVHVVRRRARDIVVVARGHQKIPALGDGLRKLRLLLRGGAGVHGQQRAERLRAEQQLRGLVVVQLELRAACEVARPVVLGVERERLDVARRGHQCVVVVGERSELARGGDAASAHRGADRAGPVVRAGGRPARRRAGRELPVAALRREDDPAGPHRGAVVLEELFHVRLRAVRDAVVRDAVVCGGHEMRQHVRAVVAGPGEREAGRAHIRIGELRGRAQCRLRRARNAREADRVHPERLDEHRQLRAVPEVIRQPRNEEHVAEQTDRPQIFMTGQVVADKHLAVAHLVIGRGDAAPEQTEPASRGREHGGLVRIVRQILAQKADLRVGETERRVLRRRSLEDRGHAVQNTTHAVVVPCRRVVLLEGHLPVPVVVGGGADDHRSRGRCCRCLRCCHGMLLRCVVHVDKKLSRGSPPYAWRAKATIPRGNGRRVLNRYSIGGGGDRDAPSGPCGVYRATPRELDWAVSGDAGRGYRG